MDLALVQQKMRHIVQQHGPWTAHNIHLGGGLYTIGDRVDGEELRLRSIVQMVRDVAGRPLRELRVVDLACLEGMYGIELARQGARVVAIEGRKANLDKARLAQETLALDNLELYLDDVRNLSKKKYGRFDVVLCLGILYHLNIPDVFTFLESIAEVCDGFVIFHTHVSMKPKVRTTYRGREYWGFYFLEHLPEATAEQRHNALWSSLEDSESFWLTRSSLFNALEAIGFTSIYECRVPFAAGWGADHATLLAIKGRRAVTVSSPLVNEAPLGNWPERPRTRVFPGQKWYYRPAKRLAARLPMPVVTLVGRLLGMPSQRIKT
jgi:2-polyprenyl-3-methyl-5-hydroxy-6-metoxy-1,4-benzoquinol methylase